MTDVRDQMTEVIRRPTAIMPSRYSLFTLSKIAKRPRARGLDGKPMRFSRSPTEPRIASFRSGERRSRAAIAAPSRKRRLCLHRAAFGATSLAPVAARHQRCCASFGRDTNDAAHRSVGGGGERNRTDDLLLAKQALSQLSYTPDATLVASSGQRLRRNPREPRGAE